MDPIYTSLVASLCIIVYHFKYINIWLSNCGFTKNPSHWWCTMVYFIDLQVTSDKMPPTLDHQSFKGNFHQARDYYNIFSRTILVFLFLLWFWHLCQLFKLSWYFQFRAFKTDTKRKALRQWTISLRIPHLCIYKDTKTKTTFDIDPFWPHQPPYMLSKFWVLIGFVFTSIKDADVLFKINCK